MNYYTNMLLLFVEPITVYVC